MQESARSRKSFAVGRNISGSTALMPLASLVIHSTTAATAALDVEISSHSHEPVGADRVQVPC